MLAVNVVGRWSVAVAIFSGAACSKRPLALPAVDVKEAVSAETEAVVPGQEGDPDALEVVPATDAARDGAGLLAEAEHISSTMSGTSYSHRTRVEGGVYDVDCSGFVDYLLGRVSPAALGELRGATVRRPLAKHFVQFLEALPKSEHWQRVARVSDLEPGDVVAWLKPVDVTSTNTGHVMVVAGRAERRASGGFVVPIIDSSAAPHGKRDPRQRAGTTGIGRGEIVLEVDESGAPLAYRWSSSKGSPRHETAIVLGRVR